MAQVLACQPALEVAPRVSIETICSISAPTCLIHERKDPGGEKTITKERDYLYTKFLQGRCCYWTTGTTLLEIGNESHGQRASTERRAGSLTLS